MKDKTANLPPHFLREWREAREMTQDQLAEKVGIDRSAISKMEKGQKPLMQYRLADFAQALHIEIAQIYSPPEIVSQNRAQPKKGIADANTMGASIIPGVRPVMMRDLPIRGHVKAGEAGLFIDQGETWGFAMRPESLRGVVEAYAVRVQDESMVPRYKPGTVLLIDPFRPANPGDNVIIQLTNGQCFVKELTRRAGGIVACAQFNPPKTVEYKQSTVRAVHLVVGVDYLER